MGGQTAAAGTVSWSCFTSAVTPRTFGPAGCSSARQTTSRFVPAAGAPVAAPGAPSNLSATVSGSTVTLNWTAPVGGDAPTSYVVQAGSSTGLNNLANFDTGSTSTTLVVLNVPAGTYFVRVRANNAAGAGAASNEFQLVVAGGAPCGSLSAPSGVSASVTGSTVVLSWTAPSGCSPTSYIIQAGSTSGASDLANFSTGSTATTFTAAGVGPGTYYIRLLSAAAGVLSAPSTEVVFVVGSCGTVPNAPANLRASVTGSTVVFTWDASAGTCAATSYRLQAGSISGASDLANTPVPGTGLTATNVGNGTYYVRVVGVNAVGQSAASNEVVVTLPPASPTLVASFQMFDPATQAGATNVCRVTSGYNSTCQLRSTSFPLGTNTIVLYEWTVQYTYGTVKTITQSGASSSTLCFSDTCGGPQSTADGVAQPLAVTLTVTDNLGTKVTATSGGGSQPPLFVRLFTC
jgi:hypothetical protein